MSSLNPLGLASSNPDWNSFGVGQENVLNNGFDAPSLNQSGLAPLGRAILVEPFEPERRASVIALPDSVLETERMLDVKVRVIELGPECYPEEADRCKPGDVVFIAKLSGFKARGPKDGKMYRLVNDRDVFALITWFGEEVQS